jgi:predicted nucleic acid-binding protein
VRKFVLDTNCFIAASRSDREAALLETFVQTAAPGLHLSTVVAAELRAGTTSRSDLLKLEKTVLKTYYKRGRILNPSAAAWEALGKTLAWLVRNEGITLRTSPRSFIFGLSLATNRGNSIANVYRDVALITSWNQFGTIAITRMSGIIIGRYYIFPAQSTNSMEAL